MFYKREITYLGSHVDYQRMPTYCNERDQYGNFSHLASAESACTTDFRCRGVVDEKCDESGPFKPCPVSKSERT